MSSSSSTVPSAEAAAPVPAAPPSEGVSGTAAAGGGAATTTATSSATPQQPASKKREAPDSNAEGGSSSNGQQQEGGGGGPPPAKKQALDVLDDLVQRVPISPHKELSVTLLLPIDRVGLIIGKGGATLKRISEDTGARIHLQEYEDITQSSKLRGVTLVGPLEAIEKAEREVLDALSHRRTTTTDCPGGEDPGRTTLRWLVPADLCGLLIGKKGIGIQQLCQDTGAWVRVAHDQEMPPGTTERLVYITGSSEAIAKAKRQVVAKVGGRAPPDEGKEGDDFVLVNTRAIGFVLGKGGADLKAISEASGAKLSVAGAAELEIGTVEIKIRITGSTAEQVSSAKALLSAKIEQWHKEHPWKLNPNDPDSKETSLKLAVPKVMIPGLIGKGGAGVKDMNIKSGASVKFLSDQASHNRQLDEKPLLLIGGLRNVLTAQKILYERIAALPSSVRQQAKPKDPTSSSSHRSKRQQAADQAAHQAAAALPALLQPSPTFNAALSQPAF